MGVPAAHAASGWQRLDQAACGIIYGAIVVLSALMARGRHRDAPLHTAAILGGLIAGSIGAAPNRWWTGRPSANRVATAYYRARMLRRSRRLPASSKPPRSRTWCTATGRPCCATDAAQHRAGGEHDRHREHEPAEGEVHRRIVAAEGHFHSRIAAQIPFRNRFAVCQE